MTPIINTTKGKAAILSVLIVALLAGLLVSLAPESGIQLTGETVATDSTANDADSEAIGTSETSTEASLSSQEVISLTDYDPGDIEPADGSDAVGITFDGDTVMAGDGVDVEGNVVYITSGGSYVISGASSEGQIIIESEDKETVNLILDGLDLTSSEGSPLIIREAKRAVITLSGGTENALTDRSEYVDPDTDEDAATSAIFSKDDLYINGAGTLIVSSENKNGIQSKDQLVIIEGDITVDAGKEAIKAKDYVLIDGGEISLASGEDGISATEDEDPEKGFVVISGGDIDIDAGQDGIQAETYVIVTGGTLSITTSGGSMHQVADTESAKGIKGESYVEIDGGDIDINAADDGIHSDGTVVINGGSLVISSADDGVHADSSLTINGGAVVIEKSYEGLESRNIHINDGVVRIYASDDGLNVADGTSTMRGGEMAITGAEVRITGGYVYIECEGDGLDSNGDLYMSGGTVIVNGPLRNDNGGIDVNGECVVDGGFLVVASSLGMAESPDQTSGQNSVIIGFSSQVPADTIIHIESESGEEIITFAPSKAFQAFVLSSEEIVSGQTYKVFAGGTATGGTDGLYETGNYAGGTLVGEFTQTSVTTTVGSVSQMGQAGPGGFRMGR